MEAEKCAHLLAEYSSSDISDALAKLGVVGHIPGLVLYSPDTESPFQVCGPAYTAEFVLKSDTVAPQSDKHHVDTCPSGSVLVIKSPSSAPNAVFGGLMATRAGLVRAKGAVIQGRIRDIVELREMKFPVWAAGQSTLGAAMFVRLSTVGLPIVLGEKSEWPVTVNNGDIIVADNDGVVSVPLDLASSVAHLCKSLRDIDGKCLIDVKAGVPLVSTFAKHRGK